MSVWSNFAVLILISGAILGGVGIVLYLYVLPWFKRKKIGNVEQVKAFLENVNKEFPPGNLTEREQESRENALINSGFTPEQIEKAQGFKLKLNKLKENKQNGTRSITGGANRQVTPNSTKTTTRDDTGTNTRTDTGTSTNGNGNRDGEVEHKRVLPIQPIESISETKRDSKWDWKRFKSNR